MKEKFRLTALEKGWILYDVGNSAFILMVSTLIPIFFNALAESAAHARNMGDDTAAKQWLHEAEAFLDTLSPNGKKNRLWNIKLKYVQDMLDDVTDKIRKH